MSAQTASQYTDRSTDYFPSKSSKLPFNFAAIAWDMIDNPSFRQLSGESIKLYVYLCRHVNLREQRQQNGRVLISGQTFWKKLEEIGTDCFGGKSNRSISRHIAELKEFDLIEVLGESDLGQKFLVKSYQDQKVIKDMEDNFKQKKQDTPNLSKTPPTNLSTSTIYIKETIKETSSNREDKTQLDIPDIIIDEISDNEDNLTQAELAWQEKHQSSARPGGKTVIPAVIESLANSFGVSPEVAEKAWVHAMPDCPESSQGIKISSPNWARTGAMFEGEWFKDGLRNEGWTDSKPNKSGGFSLSFSPTVEKLTPENSTGFDGKPSFKKYADEGINKQESSFYAMKRLFPNKRQ